jgi:hypothetical protein
MFPSALSSSYISKRNFSLELSFTDWIYGIFLRVRMPFLPCLVLDRYPQMTLVCVFIFIHRPLDSIYWYNNGLTRAIKRLPLIVWRLKLIWTCNCNGPFPTLQRTVRLTIYINWSMPFKEMTTFYCNIHMNYISTLHGHSAEVLNGTVDNCI